MSARCPSCNHKRGRHAPFCQILSHEEVQHRAMYNPGGALRPPSTMTPEQELDMRDGDVCGPASPSGLNPKDLIGATKSPLGLIPWTALVQVAPVFALGARKYGAYNWRTPGQPVQHMTYVEAAFRHLAAYTDGQTIDPESGSSHIAHAICGLLILLDAAAVGNAVDNRPTPGNAAEVMALYSQGGADARGSEGAKP